MAKCMRLARAAFIVSLIALPLTARAADLIVCNFNGTQPSLNTPWTNTSWLDPNLSFSGWQLGAGIIPTAGIDNAFGFYVNAPSDQESTLAQAVTDHEYNYFTIQPTEGTLNLSGKKVNFRIQRIDWWAPRTYAVFTSITGFNPGDELFTTTSLGNGDYDIHNFSFIMPLSGYDNITDPLEFRIYAFDARYGGHNTTMTAFSIEQTGPIYSLTVNSGPNGTATSDPEGTLFEEGTTVKLLANPDSGYHFLGWSGDVSGLGNPRVIIMDSDYTAIAGFNQNPPPAMEVGTNLAGTQDWSSEWDFADAFKMCRTWMTREVGSWVWESGMQNEIPLDPNGWPLYLPFPASDGKNHYVHTLMPVFVAGDYTMIVEGTGHIELETAATGHYYPAGGTNSYTVSVSTPGTLFLRIHESSAADPIQKLRIIMPGCLATYDIQPFHPLFLYRLQPYTSIRFMDWQKTNNSYLASWANRTTPDTYTQTREQGVALEYQIQLCNTLNKDIWVCIPHQADDDYVTQAARLLRDTVNPDLKIYVEYSNETWNGMFSQAGYVSTMGTALGLDPDSWVAGHKYVGLRSLQIWEIFENEFTNDSRLVKVLATQSSFLLVTNLRFDALNDPDLNPNYLMPDALAIAPYFGVIYTPDQLPPNVPDYPTADEILDTISPAEIAAVQNHVITQKAVADTQGCRLVCYEAGQHYVGAAGAENDDTLNQILYDVNRDPRMYDRITEYLDMLKAEGVDNCVYFTYVNYYSKWGSWGALEYQNQPITQAPKYHALLNWIDTTPPLQGDLSYNARVDLNDFHLFSTGWLQSNGCPGPDCPDIDHSNNTDLYDLTLLLTNWLTTNYGF
ncbi:MAG: hypothetical protein JW860_00835 [Sedimentisphaerales bacterium]|nr:hypothetical protein [Sedimentisphaerales bacterium]